ncbi:MAG: hypothetical protein GC206_00690 [Alphaproteobacteria bacterium]|nr:hypothetical protein [Alphaproteobacteria bacterium]
MTDEAGSTRQRIRAEAHGALNLGAAVLCVGVILALVLGALASPPTPTLAPLAAAFIAAPIVLLGWGLCAYASWRLDLLQRLAREPDLVLPKADAARSKIETMQRFLRSDRRRAAHVVTRPRAVRA